MNVVFVHQGKEHVGIEYLSAFLKKRGHTTHLCYDPDLFGINDNVFHIPYLAKLFKQSEKAIARKILDLEPDLVAFSVYTNTYQWSLSIARKLKLLADKPVVFGGVHPTFLPQQVLENSCVDYVIVGEGEETLSELLENLDKDEKNIGNLWYKKDSVIINNELRPLLNLDQLPFVDKDLFAPFIRYRDDYLAMGSRGCPNSCSYCSEAAYNNMYAGLFCRKRSVGPVIEEMKTMKQKYGFREVMFYDSIFFTDEKWLKDFSVLYKEHIDVPFRCEGHVSYFSEEVARLMKYAGCYCIDFGIQTFNEDLRRKELCRNESNEQIEKALRRCDEYGIKYDVDIIFGLPGESEEDLVGVLEFFQDKRRLNRIKTYNLSYYPGCPIINMNKKEGLLHEKDIVEINEGRCGDWFHSPTPNTEGKRKIHKNYDNLFKIYALLPVFARKLLVKYRGYTKFYIIPKPLIIIMQVINAFFKKDHRFSIFIKNYMHHFIRVFFHRK